jgi:Kyakuja-Dileera-Zisupton transposase
MNMDYALCQAIMSMNMEELHRLILYYDVNCQYIRKLSERIARNHHLHIPDGIEIIPGIGLLHVTEHKPECLPRYAPTYIKGAGLVAGEIIESLWSGLNGCAHSTRTASDANRAETLDDHMNDNNWTKLVKIGRALDSPLQPSCTDRETVETVCKQYKKAVESLPEHQGAFQDLSVTAGEDNVRRWTKQGNRAQRKRKDNVKAMDIYMAEQRKGTDHTFQLDLLINIFSSYPIECSINASRGRAGQWQEYGSVIMAG